MEDIALVIGFLKENWWWICPVIAIPLFGWLKKKAKKTKWVWDDKVTTLILGLLRMSIRREPLSEKRKKKLYPPHDERGVELK